MKIPRKSDKKIRHPHWSLLKISYLFLASFETKGKVVSKFFFYIDSKVLIHILRIGSVEGNAGCLIPNWIWLEVLDIREGT